MRKISVLPVILLIVVFFAGCTTSQVSHLPAVAGQKSSTGREVVANLKGSNNGLFLFYYIPLWSGSVTRPNRRNYECFENQLRPKYLMRMLNARAEKLEATGIDDFTMTERSTGFFTLWILWHREASASAVAVK